MYNDFTELMNFYKEKNIVFSPEPWGKTDKINEKVINFHNWDEITKEFQEKEYVVIDNFLIPEFAVRLKNFVIYSNFRSKSWNDYGGLDFLKPNHWFPLLTNIVEEMSEITLFKNLEFQRVWAFICNNKGTGVAVHADPACINANLWVAADESVINPERNGLILWNVKSPPDWTHQEYNGSLFKCKKFLAENNAKPILINHKFNRITIFNSAYFHETAGVEMKDGYENRRINYTFLFGKR